MKLLFVADPLDTFKIYKDTTFVMMREAQRRGNAIEVCQPAELSWRSGGQVRAQATRIQLTGQTDPWYQVLGSASRELSRYDLVLMRKDPPFDSEYFYATHLLSQAQREGVLGQAFRPAEVQRSRGARLEQPVVRARPVVHDDDVGAGFDRASVVK